ncbi:lasso peptide biosynthesis B2 protein [Hyphococcus luteus]|uniref:Microcin J25-processing protein McjB C-terminal domain-containing protein n=1 Tax=Hyphococcus luteus TaxID=2058213 RepID=A0A2S7K778_9PROT|nr:lasso peptide biosynthesis B2 protein [Marinicaulis flavus]PQA88308.1 hypothetical protein CW354_08390 [Marinicaulis flavus]
MFELAQNACSCEIGGTTIILDVSADKFIQTNQRQSQWLDEILTHDDRNGALSDSATQFAERLIARGILVRTTSTTNMPNRIRQEAPTASIMVRAAAEPTHIELRLLVTFCRALIECWALEHFESFEDQVRAAKKWSLRNPKSKPCNSEEAYSAIHAFHALTPYFFSLEDACRFRSLVLLRYISLLRYDASWVFGVQLSPFRAHCWVESQRVVLNDELENILGFHRIMLV